MMRKLAHIVNPFFAAPASGLGVAQPLTFASMRMARDFARGRVEVALYSAQYPEDRACVPEGFQPTPDLERSILDLGDFPKPHKLPLLADILDRLYAATDAEFLVFTNVDIALMPHFYAAVSAFIDKGYDAFAINRRTIPAKYTRIDQLPLMYAEIGEQHEGHDCFIFRRQAYAQYRLGAVCTGLWSVGRVLIWNMICHAQKFKEYKNKHLTFHLGNDRGFVQEENFPFFAHNKREALKILAELKQENRTADLERQLSRYPIIGYETMQKQ